MVARPLADVLGAMADPPLARLLAAKFALGSCLVLFETSFGLSNGLRFSLEPRHSSYLMSLVGISFSLVQGLGAARLVALLRSEALLVLVCFLTLALSLLAMGSVSSVPLLVAALVPMSLCLGTLNTVLSSMISKTQAAGGRSGEVLGITSSIGSLTRILCPLVSTSSMANISHTAPFLFASVLAFASIFIPYGSKSKPI